MPASTWSTTDKSASLTLSGSNLIATAGAANQGVRGKDPKRTGKYYIEYTSTTTQSVNSRVGFAAAGSSLIVGTAAASIGLAAGTGTILSYDVFGTQLANVLAASWTTGSVVCAAIDLDSQFCWFRVGAAGLWNNNAANNPATGIGGAPISAVGLGQGIDCYPCVFLGNSAQSVTANFGASAFTGAVPAGFTSGWDDSVAVVTNVVASQVALEEWYRTNPQAQVTQIMVEQWAAVSTVNPQVVVTTMLAEMWASVAQPGGGQSSRVMVLA
jgi:hypothetical protein